MKKQLIYGIVALVAVIAVVLTANNDTSFLQSKKAAFSQETKGLPDAVPPQTVELKDGDTYKLEAMIVKKEVGNRTVKMLGYNGSVPGPFLNVPQGATVTIEFKNSTDVETTLHSHGIRLDNRFDGVPDVTQKALAPGESFTYTINFPDAGVYWYHPHVREDYAQELGLYGNYIVEPTDPNYWSSVNREIPLVLDDILLDEKGIAPFSKTEATHALMGRFGNVMLVNGESEYRLEVKKGEVARLYFTNAANTRVFNLSIPGAKMKLVGGDTSKYERETFVDSVVLAPSERAVIEVLFDANTVLESVTPQGKRTLAEIAVSEDVASPSYKTAFETLRVNRDVIAQIDAFRSSFGKKADKRIALSIGQMSGGDMGMGGMSSNGGHMMPDGTMMGGMMATEPIEWEDSMGKANAESTSNNTQWIITDRDTGKRNMDIAWSFKQGEKVKIEIYNDPMSMHPMQHPIHFHGQRFLVLSRDGVKNTNLVWKDTVLVGAGERVEILLDVSNPGEWMAHCHIAEHLESGMMFGFTVKP